MYTRIEITNKLEQAINEYNEGLLQIRAFVTNLRQLCQDARNRPIQLDSINHSQELSYAVYNKLAVLRKNVAIQTVINQGIIWTDIERDRLIPLRETIFNSTQNANKNESIHLISKILLTMRLMRELLPTIKNQIVIQAATDPGMISTNKRQNTAENFMPPAPSVKPAWQNNPLPKTTESTEPKAPPAPAAAPAAPIADNRKDVAPPSVPYPNPNPVVTLPAYVDPLPAPVISPVVNMAPVVVQPPAAPTPVQAIPVIKPVVNEPVVHAQPTSPAIQTQQAPVPSVSPAVHLHPAPATPIIVAPVFISPDPAPIVPSPMLDSQTPPAQRPYVHPYIKEEQAIKTLIEMCEDYYQSIASLDNEHAESTRSKVRGFINNLKMKTSLSEYRQTLDKLRVDILQYQYDFALSNDPETDLFLNRVLVIIGTVIGSIATGGLLAAGLALYGLFAHDDAGHVWRAPITARDQFATTLAQTATNVLYPNSSN